MIDSGATSNGFWTPVNLCMASFVWRGQAAMIEHDMMMHPGMSMNMPVAASHLAVEMILHLAFSMLVGMVFITVLFALRRAGLGVLRTVPGYVGAAVAGAALLYVVMIYLVLPWANPLMCQMTPPRAVFHRAPGLRAGVRPGGLPAGPPRCRLGRLTGGPGGSNDYAERLAPGHSWHRLAGRRAGPARHRPRRCHRRRDAIKVSRQASYVDVKCRGR